MNFISGLKFSRFGYIPKDWNIVRLKEVVRKQEYKDPTKNESDSYKYIDISSISNEIYKIFQFQIINGKNAPSRARKLIRENDILISTVRPYLKRIAIVNSEYNNQICSTGFCVVKCSETHVDYRFIFYLLLTNRIVEILKSLQRGSSYPAVTDKDIFNLFIPNPPLVEQRKIAEILSTVDNAIEKTDAIIKESQQLKKGLMQKLFTEGIGHKRFKDTKIGRIPEEWEVKTFGNLIDEGVISKIQDGNHGEKHPKSSDYVNEGIPFILANNILNGNLDLINCFFIKKEQADKLRIGFSYTNDVLLTHKGSVGNVAIVPPINDYVMLTPQVTLYRISDENKLLRYFLKYYFENPSFQSTLKRLSMQSTRAYIGITAQKKLHIVLPQKGEQEKIINIIKSLDDKINNESETKLSLNALKKGLMQVLLTGKVRVKVK